MKKLVPALLLALTIASPAMAGRGGDQGLGIMVGNPSGLSYKMWFDDNFALDAAAGVDQGEFDVHTSILWHNFTWARNTGSGFLKDVTANGDLPFYFGFGPRVLFEHDAEFGIRLPVGLSYLPHNEPWEFFGEMAPVVRLTPDSGLDFDFAIGLRFYFPAIRARSE